MRQDECSFFTGLSNRTTGGSAEDQTGQTALEETGGRQHTQTHSDTEPYTQTYTHIPHVTVHYCIMTIHKADMYVVAL